jgi:hypothetical protein
MAKGYSKSHANFSIKKRGVHPSILFLIQTKIKQFNGSKKHGQNGAENRFRRHTNIVYADNNKNGN